MKRGQQHSLFENFGEDTRPLADRMHPTSLEEDAGQSHQIDPSKALRSMIEDPSRRAAHENTASAELQQSADYVVFTTGRSPCPP